MQKRYKNAVRRADGIKSGKESPAGGVEGAALPEIALGTHADVLDVVLKVDSYLFALKDEAAVDLAAVAGGLAPAGADGLHLLNGVGQFQQTGGAGKALEGEV